MKTFFLALAVVVFASPSSPRAETRGQRSSREDPAPSHHPWENRIHRTTFATDLGEAQVLLVLDDGTLLVSRPSTFDVIAIRDRDGDGRADDIRTAVSSIEGAHGLAMQGKTLVVSGSKKIIAADRQPDGTFGRPRELAHVGGGLVGVGPDEKLYVAATGQSALLQFDADGANERIHARGLRDIRGLAWNPETAELWAADGAELNRIGDGVNYASEPPVTKNAPAALVFGNDGFAFGVTRGRVVRIRFQEGQPQTTETIATIENARLVGLARASDGTLFVSDTRGTIHRLSETPPSMASSAAEPTRAILVREFAVPRLRGARAVIHDEAQDVYLVSGRGFVARVSPEGTVIDRFEDVESPRGMAIEGNELWIADGTSVRVLDRTSGGLVRALDLAPHGAVSLEGVAFGGDGAAYVTDSDVHTKWRGERVRSGNGRIFRINGEDEVEVAIAADELRSPAGIIWDGLQFLVAQAYGKEVVAWHPRYPIKSALRGPGAYDGITILPNGTVVVASQYDNALHFGKTGELAPLFSRAAAPAGIAFDRKRNRLLIASSEGGSLEAWSLPPIVTESEARTGPRFALSPAGSPDTSSTSR